MGKTQIESSRFSVANDRQELLDHCGILAAFSESEIQFLTVGLLGLEQIQTRGYDGAGVLYWKNRRVIANKGRGMISEVFSPEMKAKLTTAKSRQWVFHVRYGTNGGFQAENVQPFIGTRANSSEQFIVAHNGQFFDDEGDMDPNSSDTLKFTRQLEKEPGKNWDERVVNLLAKKDGAWSVVISTQDAMYLARDPRGVRPLYYGQLIDLSGKKSWVVASETSALAVMGVTKIKLVKAGEIIKIDQTGLSRIALGQSGLANCIFEPIYIQDGLADAHGQSESLPIEQRITVNQFRARCGQELAKEENLLPAEVDVVVGVPGTGIPSGQSYAQTLQLPYLQAIQDRVPQHDQRTFMTAKIENILDKVLTHFQIDFDALRGKRVVLVDDSLVRGNIMKGLIRLLTENGVLAVHVRIVSPAIDKPCHLGVNTRSANELIAHRHAGDVSGIKSEIGADSLRYISDLGMMRAIGGNELGQDFCLGCMVNHAPPPRKISQSKSVHQKFDRQELRVGKTPMLN